MRAVPRPSAGIDATVTRLDGAVETSIQLGVADVIADVVETGSTLRAAGLEIFGEVDPGVRGGADHPRRRRRPTGFEVFRRRLEGVLVARSYVMMDYDIARDHSTAPSRSRPARGPDHLAAAREGWVAVRAMVPRAGAQRLMDELYDLGARGILLTDIHACRL